MTPSVAPVLTPGEWEALIFVTPDRVKHLVLQLAIHHHAIEPPTPEQCPICQRQVEPEQLSLRVDVAG
jgi:hypothetical protein